MLNLPKIGKEKKASMKDVRFHAAAANFFVAVKDRLRKSQLFFSRCRAQLLGLNACPPPPLPSDTHPTAADDDAISHLKLQNENFSKHSKN
jgi:hypothetical protein